MPDLLRDVYIERCYVPDERIVDERQLIRYRGNPPRTRYTPDCRFILPNHIVIRTLCNLGSTLHSCLSPLGSETFTQPS